MNRFTDFIRSKGTFVPPSGDLTTAKFVFVGEQPGKVEVRRREPFVGPAGRELHEDMQQVSILKSDCYFTNVFKDLDQPLAAYWSFKSSDAFGPTPLGKPYIDLLEEELRGYKGVIIAVGGVALGTLCNRSGITKWRGSILECDLIPGTVVVPIIHPATVIPPKNVYLNKRLIQYDLLKARNIAYGQYEPTTRRFHMRPSFTEALEWISQYREFGLSGQIIAYDIELCNMELSCISFSSNNWESAHCIPFVNEKGDYFTPPQELQILREIAKILEDPNITKNGQNISFDGHFLLSRYGIKTLNSHDTMIAQKTLMQDYPVGLDFIASVWTDMPYYKGEGKSFFQGNTGRWEVLWEYNNRDSRVCAEALPKQMEQIKKMGNEAAYERQRRLVEPLVFMQEKGIRVDVSGMLKANAEYEVIEMELREKLNEMTGGLNPNSPKQIADYFYYKRGLKPYKSRKTGNADTSVDAMKRLTRRGFEEAKIILEIRRIAKIRSTYIPVEGGKLVKIDDDGRIRCSYNPVGTKFSRISSSTSIFGTGMNMQNWPHSLLVYLLPDPDYFYWSFDLAQAENRIVAYCGMVEAMIQAFEEGRDVHSLTAGLIFNKSPEDVSDEPGSCSLGQGEHSERFWGKKANHGLNYDLGYRTFALYYEINERDSKFIVEKYHLAYPGVRNRFHAMVKAQLQKNRVVTNLLGRRVLFLDQWGDSLFKEAYSCIPQGTVGDIINEYGVEYVYYNQDEFGDFDLLTQVHDSVGGQAPIPTTYEGWVATAKKLMKIKKSLEIKLSVHDREFVIPADLTVGLSFGKKSGLEIKWKEFPNNAETLAKKLKEFLEPRYEATKAEVERLD